MSSETRVSLHVDTDTVWAKDLLYEAAVFLVTGHSKNEAPISRLFQEVLSSGLFSKDHCTVQREKEIFTLQFVANISQNPGLKNEAESVIRQALTQAGFFVDHDHCTIS